MAIKKPVFLAGYSLFYESARYRAVFLAAIENNQNFTLSRNHLKVISPIRMPVMLEITPF